MCEKLKAIKREVVYVGLIIINIIVIYSTFHMGFSDVLISQVLEKNILLLTLNSYLYMTAGLMLTALTAYLYMHMASYKVGKIFTAYITMVSIGICLIAATNYRYMSANLLIGLLAFISNFTLLYSIGCLTLITRKKYFKWMMIGYGFVTVCGSIFYVICVCSNNYESEGIYGKIIIADYIITIVVMMISMLAGYSESTQYSKRQIKFLTGGLAEGIIIFIIMHSLPMLAIVAVLEGNQDVLVEYHMTNIGIYEQAYPIMHIDNMNQQQGIYPIMIFTGIIIVMIYILIKREYFVVDNMDDLRCYILTTAYLIVANTCFHFIISNDMGDFIPFNFILAVPLLLYGHRVYQKGKLLYDNNMIEVLEAERRKLSIYLHDEILQRLIAVLHSANVKDINEELCAMIADIRNVSQDIYPIIAEDLGVEEAVRVFVAEINSDYNVETEYQYQYPQGILPQGISLVIYRTIKELVTNAIKHSGCVKILVSVSEAPGGIQCMVSDDGNGFQMPENDKLLKSPHRGLYTIRKQIADLDGNMRILSDETGSEFQIYIPLR